jgi:hypothetical protein
VESRGGIGRGTSVQYRRLPRCKNQRQFIGESFPFPLNDRAIIFYFFAAVCNLY